MHTHPNHQAGQEETQRLLRALRLAETARVPLVAALGVPETESWGSAIALARANARASAARLGSVPAG